MISPSKPQSSVLTSLVLVIIIWWFVFKKKKKNSIFVQSQCCHSQTDRRLGWMALCLPNRRITFESNCVAHALMVKQAILTPRQQRKVQRSQLTRCNVVFSLIHLLQPLTSWNSFEFLSVPCYAHSSAWVILSDWVQSPPPWHASFCCWINHPGICPGGRFS